MLYLLSFYTSHSDFTEVLWILHNWTLFLFRMDVMSYRSLQHAIVLIAVFGTRTSILPWTDNNVRVSVLLNIKHASTSYPISKWDKVYITRDANPPYLLGRFPIFVNIFVHFDTQIWVPISGKLCAILKTSLFFVWVLPIFWMLLLASLYYPSLDQFQFKSAISEISYNFSSASKTHQNCVPLQGTSIVFSRISSMILDVKCASHFFIK